MIKCLEYCFLSFYIMHCVINCISVILGFWVSFVYFSLLSVVAHPFLFFLFFSPYIYVGPTGGTQLGPASASRQSSDQYATLHLVGMFCRYYPLTYRLTLLLLFGWEWLAIDLCGGNGFQLSYLYFQSFLWIYVYPATTRLMWVCVYLVGYLVVIALLFLLSLLSGMLPVDRDWYRRSYAYEEPSHSLAN